jgi:hypothetical protein
LVSTTIAERRGAHTRRDDERANPQTRVEAVGEDGWADAWDDRKTEKIFPAPDPRWGPMRHLAVIWGRLPPILLADA